MKKLLPFIIVLALFTLSCEKEISTSPEDELIPKNLLLVESIPSGSKIYINGRNSGQVTPDTISWLEDGDHLVTLKTDYFKDTNKVVTIATGFNSINFDYTKNPTMFGSLYVDSNPRGAVIYLNDSSTAMKTPSYVRGILPGLYDVSLKLPGFWDGKSNAKVVSERTVTVDKHLIDSTVWVNYTKANVNLPTDWFNCVAIQDNYIKWFGSEGEGLIRYDDSEWKIYNTANSSIPSNNVKAIETTANGLWIGTDKGAAYFSNGNFIVYNSLNSPLSNKVKCASAELGGKVWLGTEDNGLFSFDGSTWINYNKDNSPLRTNFISSLFIDHTSGIIWIGTGGEGLMVFDGTNWSRVYNSLPSPRVDAIDVTNSEVWVGCSFHTRIASGSGTTGSGGPIKTVLYNGGLALLSGTWTKYKEAGKDIVALARDNNSSIWFSDFSTGLGKRANGSWQRYNQYKNINGIAIDGAGHKWLTTSAAGIVKFKGQ